MSVRVVAIKEHQYGPYDDESGALGEVFEGETLEQALTAAAQEAWRFPADSWDTAARVFIVGEEATAAPAFQGELFRLREADRLRREKAAQEIREREQKDRLERMKRELNGLLAPEEKIRELRERIEEMERQLADGQP